MENVINYAEDKDNTLQGLYGSQITPNKSCGFCKYHKCHLTVKMLKQHNCLQKECYHLIKNMDHSWWKQRAVVKEKRRQRKQKFL